MQNLREEQLVGLAGLEAVTALLQRRRNAHPTSGFYEAAEIQWWWSVPRRTDSLGQLIWFDDQGRPEASVLMADFSNGTSAVYDEVTFCPFFMPDADAETVAHVVERGLAVASESGFESVELEVGQTDDVMLEVLARHGFAMKEANVMTETWLAADDQVEVSALHEGYRLASRAELTSRAHHMNERNPAFVEKRLRETSIYRSELDLVALDSDDNYAAYGLFWYDPETAIGVVEPMRTKDDHQKRGLARHILTTGIDKLIKAGAQSVSIGYGPDNPASGHLYRSVGFKPIKSNDLYSGPTTNRAALV